MIESVGADGGEPRVFKHPFVQACSMFLGEMLCLLTFKALFFSYRRRGVNIFNLFHRTFQVIKDFFFASVVGWLGRLEGIGERKSEFQSIHFIYSSCL